MKITTANSSKQEVSSSSGKKEFITVPEGKYLAKISRITDKQSDRTGSRSVQVALEVVKGPMAGNAVFENFIYDHSNEKAVEVGSDRSKKLGQVFGLSVARPQDLLENEENLLDQEVIIYVKNSFKREDGSYVNSLMEPKDKKAFDEGRMTTYANVKKFEAGL